MVAGVVTGRAAIAKPTARLPRFDPSTIRHFRACSPTGRRRHLEGVNSAGSNPATRTNNATVAQR